MARIIIGITVFFLAAASALPLHEEERGQSELEKNAEAWEYPGAKKHGSPTGAGLYMSLATSEDSVAKVAKHYGKKFGQAIDLKSTGSSAGGSEDKATGGLNDSFMRRDLSDPPRAVQIAVTTQRTKEYCVTVIISQAKGEKHTHIVVSYAGK